MERMLPPTYLLLAMVAMALLHVLLPGPRLVSGGFRLLGLLPLLAAVLLELRADRMFKTLGTTVRPFEESTALATDGVYAITRNPMYLGFVLLLASIAILLGTATPALPVLVFATMMDRIFIRNEERQLADTFGQSWQDYRKTVRRWL